MSLWAMGNTLRFAHWVISIGKITLRLNQLVGVFYLVVTLLNYFQFVHIVYKVDTLGADFEDYLHS